MEKTIRAKFHQNLDVLAPQTHTKQALPILKLNFDQGELAFDSHTFDSFSGIQSISSEGFCFCGIFKNYIHCLLL